ncbi:MAG: YbhB/YbcL family Raf kinase inhibitor-like protein [Polyangiales bacterium]
MRTWIPTVIVAAALAVPFAGLAKENTKGTIGLTSTEFKNGEALPHAATCDAEGKSPALAWKTSTAAKSFALVVDDPDAPKGPYVHWLLFDIPSGTTTIPHGGSAGIVGKNSADKAAFAPACPPSKSGVHHYNFHVYALDVATIGQKPGASRQNVENAIKGHVLADSTLTGTYERR